MGQTRFAEEKDSLRGRVETIMRGGVPPLRSLQTAPRPVLSFLSACLFFLLGSIRELYAFVIEFLERQEVGLWTSGVSRCGFRRRAG